MKKYLWAVGIVAILGLVYLLLTGSQEKKINFNTDIRPILNEKCISCHGGVKKSGGFSLLFRHEAMEVGESGLIPIVPGKPDSSELIARLTHHDPEIRMPYEADPLPQEEIDLLYHWIKQGAEWEEHWSFIPPDPNLTPPSTRSDWVKNDIDRFILAGLKKRGLNHSKEADKHTLIRRVSLDLTGIPPTLEEVEEFVKDESPNAYEKLVDRLLASPHFGERWGGMWLDLARYADSQGYQKDRGRNIWRYRDWVIHAFNEDMPFDQFTIEQIAGDLLESPDDQQILATAFHRNTMSNDEGGTDDEEFRVAAVLDRVTTTFEVWQGLTMGCVQCHSHPYDPIVHKEFYNLYAFFNNTADADRTDEFPTMNLLSASQKNKIEKAVQKLATDHPEIEEVSIDSVHILRKKLLHRILLAEDAEEIHQIRPRASDFGSYFTNIRPDSWVRFEQVSLDNVKSVHVQYDAKGAGGKLQIREGSVRGKVLAEVDLPSTGKWAAGAQTQWDEASVSLQNEKGVKDIFLTFTGEENQRICDLFSLYFEKEGEPTSRRAASYKLAGIRPAETPIMQELTGEDARTTRLFIRGNWLVHGEEVLPDVPGSLPDFDDHLPQNRLGLAKWLVNGNNPLTGRVIVNRFWEQIFGIGLVETLEDFGTMGTKPSNQELLDYLALQFANEYQWSVKKLLKEMVTSAAYRQSSSATPKLMETDPANRYLARGPRVRLSAEQLRDQALATSGLLSHKMYGPSVMPPQPEGVWQVIRNVLQWIPSEGEDRYRRALYTFWRRSSPYPSMMAFDAPSREYCVSRRIRTNTPLQALVTLNDSTYWEAAESLARKVDKMSDQDISEKITSIYQHAILREPGKKKHQMLMDFYDKTHQYYQQNPEQLALILPEDKKPTPELASLINIANVVMNLDEFIVKE